MGMIPSGKRNRATNGHLSTGRTWINTIGPDAIERRTEAGADSAEGIWDFGWWVFWSRRSFWSDATGPLHLRGRAKESTRFCGVNVTASKSLLHAGGFSVRCDDAVLYIAHRSTDDGRDV